MKKGYTVYINDNDKRIIKTKFVKIFQEYGITKVETEKGLFKRKDVFTSPLKAFNVMSKNKEYKIRWELKRLEKEAINFEMEKHIKKLNELLIGEKVKAKKFLNNKLDFYTLTITSINNFYGKNKFYFYAGEHLYKFESNGKNFYFLEENLSEKINEFFRKNKLK